MASNGKTKPDIKCVDFFCGGGGMSYGLQRAGIHVLGALDNDPDCRETYEANHPDSKFILDDITRAEPKMLKKTLGIRRNDPELLFVGCSPCQYWSTITGANSSERKQKSRASRNLLHDFLRFVKYYRPGFILVENVRGILRNQEESGLADLLRFLDNKGYNYKTDILTASHYGVPQTRQRFVLIASRLSKTVALPKPRRKISTVREHIGEQKNIPAIEAGAGPHPRDFLHRSPSLNKKNITRLRKTPEGGERKHWAIKSLLIPAYKDKPLSFFRENYGRMSWDRPAPTITTKFYAIGCGRFGHPDQNRAISLREGALLQTFPKRYKFKTQSFHATGKLIGNAVPPKLAEYLGKAILSAND